MLLSFISYFFSEHINNTSIIDFLEIIVFISVLEQLKDITVYLYSSLYVIILVPGTFIYLNSYTI